MPRARGVAARRHARAVFDIALERDELDQWEQDLARIAGSCRNPEFMGVLEDTRVSSQEKLDYARQSLDHLGPLATNLALLLASRGRMALAPDIAEEYSLLLRQHRGVEVAQVTAAVELDDGQRDGVRRALEEFTGKTVELEVSVDPEVLGGLVIRIGDKRIDGSIRARLTQLQETLARG